MRRSHAERAEEPFRILLVENDEVDVIAFRRMVSREKLPYNYLIAGSIQEAAALLQDPAFDLIVTDYDLGDGTGFDVMSKSGNVPVIFVTGRGNEHIAVEAMKAGAYDYLTKDDERQYLELFPVVITKVMDRRKSELEAGAMMAERIRRQTLEDFIRDASHDLRTPLTIMTTSRYLLRKLAAGLLESLESTPPDLASVHITAERLQESIRHVVNATDSLERIVADMLYMIEVDNLPNLSMELLDLNMVVTEVVEKFERYAGEKQNRLLFDPHEHQLMIQGSSVELISIMRNLVKNAIDYTPANGTIIVSTALQTSEAVLIVQDTGIGIPQEELDNIFRRFYRIDKARPTDAGSTGLGLAIVHRLVELHHGRIDVESIVGEGSTFKVYFPTYIP